MNADTETNLATVFAAIVAAIAAKFPDLVTVEFFREDRTELKVPACLLDIPSFDGAAEFDPGTGQLAVLAKFEAELILGFRTPDAKLAAAELAAALAAFVHAGRWPGARTGIARDINCYRSDFKPQLDQYEVWAVEWSQVIHLGTSDWNATGLTPTTVFLSTPPDIGLGNEDKYEQISP